jgi:hypothetical protein
MVGDGQIVADLRWPDVRNCIAAGQPHREAGAGGRSDPKASVDRLTRCANYRRSGKQLIREQVAKVHLVDMPKGGAAPLVNSIVALISVQLLTS